MLLNKADQFGNGLRHMWTSLPNTVYQIFIDEQAKYKTTREGRGPIGA
jgi:hypothetical protein